jgi:hypothetical protein
LTEVSNTYLLGRFAANARSILPDATIAATAAIAAAVRTQRALRVAYLVVEQAIEEPGIGTVRATQWLAVDCDGSVYMRRC